MSYNALMLEGSYKGQMVDNRFDTIQIPEKVNATMIIEHRRHPVIPESIRTTKYRYVTISGHAVWVPARIPNVNESMLAWVCSRLLDIWNERKDDD